MILTVTLNPAVDKTVQINNFRLNSVNRIDTVRMDAGGKGINVSKVIAVLGGTSKAIGFRAGKTGEFIKDYLVTAGIDNEFVIVQGETRTNMKIVDSVQGTNTDINESGPELTGDDIKKLEQILEKATKDDTVLVFSGSVPGNVSKDIYQKWIKNAKGKGVRTILDADGDLLRLGIDAGPYLIKPNIHEMERLFEKKIATVEEGAACAQYLIDKYGINVIAVSMGEQGALFVNEKMRIFAKSPKVTVNSTVGAGDSMVAALAYAIDNHFTLEKAVTLAVAAGTANVMTSGTEPSSLENILQLEKQVSWQYL